MTSNPMTGAGTAGRDDLVSMLAKGATFRDVSSFLDALDRAGRVAETRKLGAKDLLRLWELSKGQRPLDLAKFVDRDQETVIYEGKNGLPTFSLFQKRFYRPAQGPVVGYNHNGGFATFFSGPGYFTTEQAAGGEIAFDYIKMPTFQPPGWPELRPNTGLIPGLVFGGMIDFARAVADGVVIGAAFKGGKPRDQYFVLSRAA